MLTDSGIWLHLQGNLFCSWNPPQPTCQKAHILRYLTLLPRKLILFLKPTSAYLSECSLIQVFDFISKETCSVLETHLSLPVRRLTCSGIWLCFQGNLFCSWNPHQPTCQNAHWFRYLTSFARKPVLFLKPTSAYLSEGSPTQVFDFASKETYSVLETHLSLPVRMLTDSGIWLHLQGNLFCSWNPPQPTCQKAHLLRYLTLLPRKLILFLKPTSAYLCECSPIQVFDFVCKRTYSVLETLLSLPFGRLTYSGIWLCSQGNLFCSWNPPLPTYHKVHLSRYLSAENPSCFWNPPICLFRHKNLKKYFKCWLTPLCVCSDIWVNSSFFSINLVFWSLKKKILVSKSTFAGYLSDRSPTHFTDFPSRPETNICYLKKVDLFQYLIYFPSTSSRLFCYWLNAMTVAWIFWAIPVSLRNGCM